MAYNTPSERVAVEDRLLARIRELEAEVQRLREALEQAADAIDDMRMPRAKAAALQPEQKG